MTASRVCALWALGLWILLFGAPAWAQAPMNAGPGDRDARVELNSEIVQYQRLAFEGLRRRARELSGNDEKKFTALMRRAMTSVTRGADSGTRDSTFKATPNAATTIAALDPSVQPTELDGNPGVQAAVRRLLASGERGIKMVGARDLEEDEHQLTVALLQPSNQTACSGVVIAPGALLTAAHCVCELGLDTTVRRIAFGKALEHATFVDTIPSMTRVFPYTGTGKIPIFCAGYRSYNRICYRDIALVRFDDKKPLGLKNIDPWTRFATQSDLASARARARDSARGELLPFEVVGFGDARIRVNSAKFEYGNANRKRAARFTLFTECDGSSILDCRGGSAADSCLPGLEIRLIDLQTTSDSCSGDSGGPAYLWTPTNQWRLAGLVSRALRQDGSCGPGGLYSLVFTDAVVSWLQHNGVVVLH